MWGARSTKASPDESRSRHCKLRARLGTREDYFCGLPFRLVALRRTTNRPNLSFLLTGTERDPWCLGTAPARTCGPRGDPPKGEESE
jgi:hypothetical protein